jgi:hypothetical protein
MRKCTRTWVLAATAIAFLAPASVAVAGDQISVNGSLLLIPNSATTFLIIGDASHLGIVTGVATEQPYGNSFTLVVANGDTISGYGVFTSFTPLNSRLAAFTENITITGGTGRFAGATGSAMGQGLVSLTTGVVEESFQGTISSPGSLP